ncbi:hypothetical protein RND81_07G029000 [Saponaria officinalis]|uniref:Uncharacterized protein n=1 Tax=Saponaria officinalis TaxID=3572 RepID=A0AAW1JN66_SAPOF
MTQDVEMTVADHSNSLSSTGSPTLKRDCVITGDGFIEFVVRHKLTARVLSLVLEHALVPGFDVLTKLTAYLPKHVLAKCLSSSCEIKRICWSPRSRTSSPFYCKFAESLASRYFL